MRSTSELASELGFRPDELVRYGAHVGKVPVPVARRLIQDRPKGRLVLVTGMTPTTRGEGKTVTTIGLNMALRSLGHRSVACLRQPSLGPVFGIKGGATGGGEARVEPAAEINLGLTGDFDAIAAAHNLLAAVLDNHLYHGNALDIDPASISWGRTLDVEDRALRRIVLNPSGDEKSPPRNSNFVITAASEVMAIAGLARDYTDLKDRLARILVGARRDGSAVRAADLRVVGAMTVLLRRAMEPNLLQSSDGGPVLVHGGPFGNIAHGTCSRISIELGLAVSDYCVVEAGFATELGAEKFVDIACPAGGFEVSAGVLVATLRGLRRQGGVSEEEVGVVAAPAVEKGLANLEQHLSNLDTLGIPAVVALNRFPGDAPDEIALVEQFCQRRGVPVATSTAFTEGAPGAAALAQAVVARSSDRPRNRLGYPEGTPPRGALEMLVQKFYGGSGLSILPEASDQLATLGRWNEESGPLCVAKTPLSLSDDPKRIGGRSGFTATARRFSRSAGAGFTVVYLGAIQTMPGLPAHPAAEAVDLDADGQVIGLR